jgi:hypothetical protein
MSGGRKSGAAQRPDPVCGGPLARTSRSHAFRLLRFRSQASRSAQPCLASRANCTDVSRTPTRYPTTLHPFAASGHNHLPRDPAGVVAGQKCSGQRNVVRLADAAERRGFLHIISKLAFVHSRCPQPSVSIIPGSNEFTRILRGPSSCDSETVIAFAAALLAL